MSVPNEMLWAVISFFRRWRQHLYRCTSRGRWDLTVRPSALWLRNHHWRCPLSGPLGPDNLISNDFLSKDYLYIQIIKTEPSTDSLRIPYPVRRRHNLGASKGADIADINGDGLLAYFRHGHVARSLPTRLKPSHYFPRIGDKFQFHKTHGYNYQFSSKYAPRQQWRRTIQWEGPDCQM